MGHFKFWLPKVDPGGPVLTRATNSMTDTDGSCNRGENHCHQCLKQDIEWNEAKFGIVSEPDPSRKGLGTCLHASCPHGMYVE